MSYPDERISETPLDFEEYSEFVETLRTKGKLFVDELSDIRVDATKFETFSGLQLNHIQLLLFSILRTNVEIWRLLEENADKDKRRLRERWKKDGERDRS